MAGSDRGIRIGVVGRGGGATVRRGAGEAERRSEWTVRPDCLYGGCLRFARSAESGRGGRDGAGTAKASRAPRSDSLRNRERLLAAARDVFAEGGPGASLEAVARRPGVGIGTLYRHFPTREALFQAVYRHEVDELVALAEALSADADPREALRRWLHANIGVVATKTGMLAALAPIPDGSRALFADSRARLVGRGRRADAPGRASRVASGPTLPPTTCCGAFRHLLQHEGPDWQARVTRLVDVFIDGLATRA